MDKFIDLGGGFSLQYLPIRGDFECFPSRISRYVLLQPNLKLTYFNFRWSPSPAVQNTRHTQVFGLRFGIFEVRNEKFPLESVNVLPQAEKKKLESVYVTLNVVGTKPLLIVKCNIILWHFSRLPIELSTLSIGLSPISVSKPCSVALYPWKEKTIHNIRISDASSTTIESGTKRMVERSSQFQT